jgi:hypothetical protein
VKRESWNVTKGAAGLSRVFIGGFFHEQEEPGVAAGVVEEEGGDGNHQEDRAKGAAVDLNAGDDDADQG